MTFFSANPPPASNMPALVNLSPAISARLLRLFTYRAFGFSVHLRNPHEDTSCKTNHAAANAPLGRHTLGTYTTIRWRQISRSAQVLHQGLCRRPVVRSLASAPSSPRLARPLPTQERSASRQRVPFERRLDQASEVAGTVFDAQHLFPVGFSSSDPHEARIVLGGQDAVGETFPHDHIEREAESPGVVGRTLVESKNLLRDVSKQVVGSDGDIRAVQPALQQRPEALSRWCGRFPPRRRRNGQPTYAGG